jgi:hypothetical protein
MRRELTPTDALAAIVSLLGGIAVLSFALFSLFDGYGWQTLAFGGGGAYLVVWAAARLTFGTSRRG